MKEITFTLLERIGLLLVIAFVLTRIPNFKALLYRELDIKMTLIHTAIFGIFGMIGTSFGVIITEDNRIYRGLLYTASDDQLVVSLSLIAIVIAGLLGGPLVGLGAGFIAGIHLAFVGGIGVIANLLVNPLSGLLAGLMGRFFSKARVISPVQALFIGMFPPILQMQLLLVLYPQDATVMQFVNIVGLPLVLANSIAIAVFTAMIEIVLREQENEAALVTRQALTIAEEALPFLKIDSPRERAEGIANLLYDRLKVAAISVTSQDEVLAFKGVGADHHHPGEKIITPLSQMALAQKEIKIAYTKDEIACNHINCPLEAAIIIPITEADEQTSLIKFYFKKGQQIRVVEKALAQGIGQLISNQLKVIASENLKKNIIDAELRNLQAQINPHFLFNTLHLIATLFRVDPKRARHITIQLASFMRFNLGLASESLISLERECAHVNVYIEIIEARFSNRLNIQFNQDPISAQVLIPPSTIQPLVENAIQHGLRQVTRKGKIVIDIKNREEGIVISVRDNGVGFTEEQLAEVENIYRMRTPDSGAGLYNVNQRLISLIGAEARLHFQNLQEQQGSIVYFTIPFKIRTRGK